MGGLNYIKKTFFLENGDSVVAMMVFAIKGGGEGGRRKPPPPLPSNDRTGEKEMICLTQHNLGLEHEP